MAERIRRRPRKLNIGRLPQDVQAEVMARVRDPQDFGNLVVALTFPGKLPQPLDQAESYRLASRFILSAHSSRVFQQLVFGFSRPSALEERAPYFLKFSSFTPTYADRKTLDFQPYTKMDVMRFEQDKRSLDDVRTIWATSRIKDPLLHATCDAYRLVELGKYWHEWQQVSEVLDVSSKDDEVQEGLRVFLDRQYRPCHVRTPKGLGDPSTTDIPKRVVSLMSDVEITITMDVFQVDQAERTPVYIREWLGTAGIVFIFDQNRCRACAANRRGLNKSMMPAVTDLRECRQQEAVVFNAWAAGQREDRLKRLPAAPRLVYDEKGDVRWGRREDLYKAFSLEAELSGESTATERSRSWEMDMGIEIRLKGMERPLMEGYNIRQQFQESATVLFKYQNIIRGSATLTADGKIDANLGFVQKGQLPGWTTRDWLKGTSRRPSRAFMRLISSGMQSRKSRKRGRGVI